MVAVVERSLYGGCLCVIIYGGCLERSLYGGCI